MCGSPDGYGSISSTYDFGASAPSSLETSQVRSRSQISCHLGSMECGSNRRSLMGARRLARGACHSRAERARHARASGMSDSTLKGAIAEAAITAAAVELGIVVLRPGVEGRRYDLVFDIDRRLYRVQCKWAPRRGAIIDVHLST